MLPQAKPSLTQINHCDHGHETFNEVRRMLIDDQQGAILCRKCYWKERKYQEDHFNVVVPEWSELPVYPF